MTQNEKELLLKDICARLPYRIIVGTTDNDGSSENVFDILWYNAFIENVKLINCTGRDADKIVDISEVKPYLFPLSSMTEEHIFEINDILGEDFEIDKYGITDLIRNRRTSLSYLELDTLFEYFNKNHFDYRGLIEKGLAIDATGLNIY